ncbi:MAG: hypothetical protein O3B75_07725 [Planctomycetota bacterium]|nr:hypothetical protein [Planctomycetota bacterium]
MKKTILAGLMVVAFCITWWVVAGEAWQEQQALGGTLSLQWEARMQARWAAQFKWGIGAGLLVDVLLLAGILAWSKLTTKA